MPDRIHMAVKAGLLKRPKLKEGSTPVEVRYHNPNIHQPKVDNSVQANSGNWGGIGELLVIAFPYFPILLLGYIVWDYFSQRNIHTFFPILIGVAISGVLIYVIKRVLIARLLYFVSYMLICSVYGFYLGSDLIWSLAIVAVIIATGTAFIASDYKKF